MTITNDMWKSRQETALYTCTTGYGDKELLSWPNRGATGLSLGIIELRANIAFAPGNINQQCIYLQFPRKIRVAR